MCFHNRKTLRGGYRQVPQNMYLPIAMKSKFKSTQKKQNPISHVVWLLVNLF